MFQAHLWESCLLRRLVENKTLIIISYIYDAQRLKRPLCTLRIRAGWSRPSLPAYKIDGYCSMFHRTEMSRFNCMDAQAYLDLRCSHTALGPFSYVAHQLWYFTMLIHWWVKEPHADCTVMWSLNRIRIKGEGRFKPPTLRGPIVKSNVSFTSTLMKTALA